MKTIKFLGVAAMVALMASCGSKNEKAYDTNVSDDTVVNADNENLSGIDITDIDVIDVEGLEPDSDEAYEAELSQDIDGLLKKYGDLLEKYTKIAKKVAGGDTSAVNELTSLTNDYQELTNDLNTLKESMNAEQAKKFADMGAKFAKELASSVDVSGALDKLNNAGNLF